MSNVPAILVVEDEYPIQQMIEDTLTEAGFRVTVLSSGEKALSAIATDGAEYKALVTDIGLGGRLKGWDVAKYAREKEPTVAVIYMTGHSADQWASQGVPNSVLLEKPFAPAQLVTAVAQLLNIGGQGCNP